MERVGDGLPPLVARRAQRRGEGAPLELQEHPPVECVEVTVRRSCRGKAEPVLHAVERLMGEDDAARIRILGQRPDHHRPVLAVPVDGRVGDPDLLRQDRRGHRLVANDGTRTALDEECGTAEADAPQMAGVAIAHGA